MVKVKVKKNIKPKIIKQKQKQSQKTNVTVNISSDVIKKKRGRPSKRSTIEKKPTSQQPITQSYNQPIFKQSTPQQPSSLTSSILASQNIPKVIKEEVKEESTIRKALTEQNIETDDPITKRNDLERVRVERIKKVEKPKEDKAIRSGLFSQMLSDQGDDTEEIQSLFQPSDQTTIYPKSSSSVSNISSLTASGTSTPTPLSRPVNSQSLYDKLRDIQTATEPEPDLFSIINEVPTQEEIIQDEESQTENPLLTQQQEPPSTILEEEIKPPTITQSLQAEETLRSPDQYTTEQLVKGEEPSNEIPTAQANIVKITPSEQIENKWRELNIRGGLLQDSKPTIEGKRKTSLMKLKEIKDVEPEWNTTGNREKPGPKPKPKPATTEPLTPEIKVKRGRPPKRNEASVEEV